MPGHRRLAHPKAAVAVLTAALLAALLMSATPAPARADSGVDTVIIEMRVWQRVDNLEDVWVSARPRGGRWDTLGTIPLAEDGRAWSYGEIGRHSYGDIAMAGVGVRVWQRTHEPDRIYVQACAELCPSLRFRSTRVWRPLGRVLLPLDDGHSPGGRYRYGDIDIAVPRGSPGLLADREYLLALRDVLAGDGAELDWDVGTPTTSWEGVTVARTPPRVSALRLVDRGLTGEIWGYLGDLTELRVLRLNGNALRGTLPSKLSLLAKLRWLYLSDNEIEGCVPPGLRLVRYNDLNESGLVDCPVPNGLTEGTQRLWMSDAPDYGRTPVLVFDVPHGRSFRTEYWDAIGQGDQAEPFQDIFEAATWGAGNGFALRSSDNDGVWLFLDEDTGEEVERSHYSGCIYDCGTEKSPAALLEQLAASVWVDTIIDDEDDWAWP